jgi:urea transporter/murein DD-endopeptidase MepM/ murein hydrolase activator NlpD
LKNKIAYLLKAVINSYAILFFSQNKILGLILLAVSFFNPVAGAAGLICVIISLICAICGGYYKQDIEKGLFSFNPLLFGIGFGTFYHPNVAFFTWLVVGCLVCDIITISLYVVLIKRGLPMLSLPFVITFWLVLSAAGSIFNMGLEQKSSAIMYELATAMHLNVHCFPFYIDLFFRSLSAMLFQNNAIVGLCIAVGLLIHSRIAFSVAVIGFITACLFNHFTGVFPEGLSYYHLGSNLIIAAIAIGSFFVVPSFRSYLWAVFIVPLVILFIIAFTRIAGPHDLPVLSLPFCLVTILLIYFLKIRGLLSKTVLTPLQFYSPEINLYQYINSKERLNDYKYFNLKLPFMGAWKVSQGYNGGITHQDEWAQALDFVIEDDVHHTYKNKGTKPEDYYCYSKPVLACGDGVVVSVADHIEDNEIGNVNIKDNWGNSIVIRHTTGLYSKVSHLKKSSFKVKAGDNVKQGDIIALCGSSGRSPEPHLHFQLQATPGIGSKTISYPFSGYITQSETVKRLCSFTIPAENETVSPVGINGLLKDAFSFQPGYTVTVTTSNGCTETFEAGADAWNETYLHSKEQNAYAYFVNNGATFYFTAYYGTKKSLLYLFYKAAYKVVFAYNSNSAVADTFPLQHFSKTPLTWLNDLLSPFYQFIKVGYTAQTAISTDKVVIQSRQARLLFGRPQQLSEAKVRIGQDGVQEFTFDAGNIKLEAKWDIKNAY